MEDEIAVTMAQATLFMLVAEMMTRVYTDAFFCAGDDQDAFLPLAKKSFYFHLLSDDPSQAIFNQLEPLSAVVFDFTAQWTEEELERMQEIRNRHFSVAVEILALEDNDEQTCKLVRHIEEMAHQDVQSYQVTHDAHACRICQWPSDQLDLTEEQLSNLSFLRQHLYRAMKDAFEEENT